MASSSVNDSNDNLADNSRGSIFSDEQRLRWLRLYRSENVGPSTFRELIRIYGSSSAALDILPEIGSRHGRAIRVASLSDVESEYERLLKLGGRLICLGEPDYPSILRSSEVAPPLISVLGSFPLFGGNSIAFVGSRNASLASVKFATLLSQEVGEAGYAVVSGFARGIDTAAHEGSLATGTIAVFAGGVDVIYPDENRDLASRIISNGGAIISELPLGSYPRAQDFPRRNRIVSGLSLGVVVVEAAQRSGSLISARYANEMGRMVFAVPGSPLDPRSVGTNGLIRDGATLVTCSGDILEALEPLTNIIGQSPYSLDDIEAINSPDLFDSDDIIVDDDMIPNSSDRDILMNALDRTPMPVDDLVYHTGLSVSRINILLLELAISGLVERHSGNRVSLI